MYCACRYVLCRATDRTRRSSVAFRAQDTGRTASFQVAEQNWSLGALGTSFAKDCRIVGGCTT